MGLRRVETSSVLTYLPARISKFRLLLSVQVSLCYSTKAWYSHNASVPFTLLLLSGPVQIIPNCNGTAFPSFVKPQLFFAQMELRKFHLQIYFMDFGNLLEKKSLAFYFFKFNSELSKARKTSCLCETLVHATNNKSFGRSI